MTGRGCWGGRGGKAPGNLSPLSGNLGRGHQGTIWAGSARLTISASFIRIFVALPELPEAPGRACIPQVPTLPRVLLEVTPLGLFSEPVFSAHTHTHTQNKIKQSVISWEIHPAGLFYFGAKIVLSKLTTDNRAVQASLTSRFYASPVLGSQSSIGQSLCPWIKALFFENTAQISKKKWRCVPPFIYNKEGIGLLIRPSEKECHTLRTVTTQYEARGSYWDGPSLLSLKNKINETA